MIIRASVFVIVLFVEKAWVSACSARGKTSVLTSCYCKKVKFITKILPAHYTPTKLGGLYHQSFFEYCRTKTGGRLHFCSHSLFFVPDDTRAAILCFLFDKFTSDIKPFVPQSDAFRPHNKVRY